jgi:hypothetical protein
VEAIRIVMEKSGIEFLDNDGVRRRNDVMRSYEGARGCEAFFEYMLQTVKEKGGEIVAVFQSPEDMAESCGVKHGKLGRLKHIAQHAAIKCLLPAPLEACLLSPSFQFRTILRQHLGVSSYFIFDNKHALVIAESNTVFKFIVYDSDRTVRDYKQHFFGLWNLAPPVYMQLKDRDDRPTV